ncbi:MAG: CpXC domain-containing protein [Treponema sp.]|nr:CpXC domain-containing protein [Treponema sp.]
MIRQIPCFCDNTLEVDIPEEVNLDTEPGLVEAIITGTFLNFTCPSCGKKHKPEFALTVLWPAKQLALEVLPELDRGEFYRRQEDKKAPPKETVISFPELSERIAILRDGLEVNAIEAIKYYLYMKAAESWPDDEVSIWYQNSAGGALEFHIHGIKENEVAVSKIPLTLYNKTLGDYRQNPKAETFSSLRVKSYTSVQNLLRPEELM